MLINRLVLNLRTYEKPSVNHLQSQTLPKISFAPGPTSSRILGSIGAPLDHDQWTTCYEEEETEAAEECEERQSSELVVSDPAGQLWITELSAFEYASQHRTAIGSEHFIQEMPRP